MSNTFAKILQYYFPGFDIWTSRINDKTYLNVDGFVSYTLKEEGQTVIIEDMTMVDKHKSIYRDEEIGKHYDSLYAMHAIVNIIISTRDILNASLIISDNGYLDIYFERVYKLYTKNGAVNISELINIESRKFPHLTINGKLYSTNDKRIGYNVAYYPPMEVLEHYDNFSIQGLVIPFEPAIQNARVLIRSVKNVPIDIYRGILMELMINANLSDSTCMDIIDSYFPTITREMVSSIPLFKYFNAYIVDKYQLINLGYYEQISKMSGIDILFINDNKNELEPYAINILKDDYCPLEYIIKNKSVVRKNGLWGQILMHNRNMTRSFLIKHIRKYPNALLRHINILEPGDERLFKRYRRKIDWDMFCLGFEGTRLDILQILFAANKYIDDGRRRHILKIQDKFLK